MIEKGVGSEIGFVSDVAQNVVMLTNNQRKLTNLISPNNIVVGDPTGENTSTVVRAVEQVIKARDQAAMPDQQR